MSTPGPERLLVFDLGRTRYGLALSDVDGLAGCAGIRSLPGAPRAVLGLSEWRGSLLTVLDLPRLLGHHPRGREPACLVRLGKPAERTAFRLPARIRLLPACTPESSDGPPAADSDTVIRGRYRHAEGTVHVLDPLRLVRRLENELWGLG